jgi:Ni,Fe-hydrogenase I small subunit
MTEIHRGIAVEELISEFPQSVAFMVQAGLPCFVCGEPTWGTFEEMAKREGKTETEIARLVEEMRTQFMMRGQ